MAILPCACCQLFVGSLTHQHRTTPPATRPRPQHSDPLATMPGTARAAHPFCGRVHAQVPLCAVHAREPAENGGLEQCRASWPGGLSAEDGGAWRGAWCDAGESGFPRRAGNTRTEGWPCHVAHSAHLRLKPCHEPSSQVGMDWWGCKGCDGFGRAGCGRRDGGDQGGSLIEARLGSITNLVALQLFHVR